MFVYSIVVCVLWQAKTGNAQFGTGGMGSGTRNMGGGFGGNMGTIGNTGMAPGNSFIMPAGQTSNVQCVPITSQACGKYGFNSTAFPNYMGHMNTQPGELLLSKVFQQTQYCHIPRNEAELIGCSIVLPLCIDGKKIPPCKEDCLDGG